MAEEQSAASKPAPASKPAGRPESRDQRPRGRPGGGPGGGGGRRFFRKKKVDYFAVNKIDDINYKDVDVLKQFIGDRGKILPRRHTGLGAMHQRKLKIAIKRARNIALLPFAGGSDMLRSPKIEKSAEVKAAEAAAAKIKAAEAAERAAAAKAEAAERAAAAAAEAEAAEPKAAEPKAADPKAAEPKAADSVGDAKPAAETKPAAESQEG